MNNIETNEMNEVAEILNMDLSEGETAVQTGETTGTETEGSTPSAAEKKKAINLTDLRYVKAYIEKCVSDGIAAAVKKFTDGTETAAKATNAVNATNDKDGNEFSATYYKKSDSLNAESTDFTNAEWHSENLSEKTYNKDTDEWVDTGYLVDGAVYEILVAPNDSAHEPILSTYEKTIAHGFIVFDKTIFNSIKSANTDGYTYLLYNHTYIDDNTVYNSRTISRLSNEYVAVKFSASSITAQGWLVNVNWYKKLYKIINDNNQTLESGYKYQLEQDGSIDTISLSYKWRRIR